jgi:hypothetical protein
MADMQSNSPAGLGGGRRRSHSKARSTPTFDHDSREAGFSLIQVIIAATLLLLAALSLSGVQINSMALSATNRETTVARNLVRQILEQIQDLPIADVYATYNDDPTDDPDGDSTAPGSTLALSTEAGDMTATISFPGFGTLREDVTDAELGMPQDLNGDGAIDCDDHSGDYRLLPVRVLVQWRGRSGTRTMEMHATLLQQ